MIFSESLSVLFWFDMSQLNLNNFGRDRAIELSLDVKRAFFLAVSEYAFNVFRFYLLAHFQETSNSAFLLT